MLKRILKNERGLTLIELLAVVVILGIIAAIAIPSVGGLIDNSKKDAHVANARQMIASAKMAASADPAAQPGSSAMYLSLKYLENNGYIDSMKDPDTAGYTIDADDATTPSSTEPTGCYVKVTKDANGKYTYGVKLTNANRGIWQIEDNLTRANVVASPTKPTSGF